MWRSAALPGAATVLFAVSTVLIAVPVPLHSVRMAGGVLGLAAGLWISVAIRRDLNAGDRTAPEPDR
jgi:hypothetical protein